MPSSFEQEVAEFLIETLGLEDVSASEIDPDGPLFGDGLGLDSVDALEIGVALKKRYGIQIDRKDEAAREYFRSLRSLADLISTRRS